MYLLDMLTFSWFNFSDRDPLLFLFHKSNKGLTNNF